MTAQELKDLQNRIKFDAPSAAKCMGIHYETYRGYLYGHSPIPAHVERAALELEHIEQQLNKIRLQNYDDFLATIPAFYGEPCES